MKLPPLFIVLFGTAVVVTSTDAFLPTSMRLANSKILSNGHHHYHKTSQHSHAQATVVRLNQSSTASAATAASSLHAPSASTTKAIDTISTEATNAILANVRASPLVQSLASSTLFILADITIKHIFHAKGICFPSSLAGCCAMAVTLLIHPLHAQMYQVLAPGAKLLQKFLMIFLVPNLIVLPLCDGCGNVTEVLKIFFIISGGFLFSLLSTSYSVCGVRKIFRRNITPDIVQPKQHPPASDSNIAAVAAIALKPKPFSDDLTFKSRFVAVVSGVAALLIYHCFGQSSKVATTIMTPLLVTLSMLAATLHNFCFGARLPKSVTQIIHPLVTCTTLTWVWSYLLGTCTGFTFLQMIHNYRRGCGAGAALSSMTTLGAGDILTFVLGPAVLSLGVSIYERRQLIRQNWKEVVTAINVSCIGGLFGTALAVRLLGLATSPLRLSLLPRNITSALAAAIAEIVGASKPLAVSFAVVTGLIGANFGASLLNYFGIHDPVARGLGIGSASHGLGTAAFVDEKDAFPFAAIGMTLTAICGTILVSVPVVKKLALQLALGGL